MVDNLYFARIALLFIINIYLMIRVRQLTRLVDKTFESVMKCKCDIIRINLERLEERLEKLTEDNKEE